MTPMQQQYNEIKKNYGDSIVLFRLGDFYEAFNEDAEVVSKILGITLTGRGKGENRNAMAGIPHHALNTYLPRLIKAGLKVAIADQLEEPMAGKLVERDVTKLITPGTVLDDSGLETSKNNYIASVYKDNKSSRIALVYSDLSTGEFYASFAENENVLKSLLNKLCPSEILSPDNLIERLQLNSVRIEKIDTSKHEIISLQNILHEHFKVKSLKSFGIVEKEIIFASGILLEYLKKCQKNALSHITLIKRINNSDFMQLDFETIRNLELIFSSNGDEATLLNTIDECRTSMGKRKLRRWLLSPLINKQKIEERLNIAEFFFGEQILCSSVRDSLVQIADLERLSGKIGVNNINPKELVALKQSIDKSVLVFEELSQKNLPNELKNITSEYKKHYQNLIEVKEHVENSLDGNPPVATNVGGIFKEGFNAEIDEIRSLRFNSKKILLEIQSREVMNTGINSLKISYNQVFGYYIEITKSNLHKVPQGYVRKQTLANAERYITEELKILEEKILGAEERLIKLESLMYSRLVFLLSKYIDSILALGNLISELDVLANFGFIAKNYRFCKPEIIADKLIIKNGRHPVVERLTTNFVPNSTEFSLQENIHILTGPNMSGKSTYIRQVAILTILAQIGSFVPADEFKFAIKDKVFTRVGASDNLARGESTFMVEMIETANILNNATKDSLVILDEVGRGTSTYDGVAIAWSIIEFINKNINCFTLFATHYHELTDLEKRYKSIKNYSVSIKEEGENVIFLHKIIVGPASKSYGVFVAKLAGVPSEVVLNAGKILMEFEKEGSNTIRKSTKKNIALRPKKINTSQLSLMG